MFLERIAVIGVGLIGGSFSLALKEKKLCRHVVGGVAVDRGDPPGPGSGEIERRVGGHPVRQAPRSFATTGAIACIVVPSKPWNTM